MAQIQLSDAEVRVNNEQVAIVANSLVIDEGLGEQSIRVASLGGGATEQIYSNNVESNMGMVKFSLHSTPDNAAAFREWKTNRNQNLVQVLAKTPDGKQYRKTFSQAAVLNRGEFNVGVDGDIAVEFTSNPAV